MIPRRIHYCWLSDEEMPEAMKSCMQTWRDTMPNWEVKRWNMARTVSIASPWLQSATANKQWAFASDYIRIWALYNEGGIYLDTDVEVLKDISPLLDCDLLVGEESGTGMIEAAIIGALAGNSIMKKILDSFEEAPTGETLPERMKRIIGDDVVLLDSDVLSPKNWRTGKINITKRTYTIHHFAGSWLSSKEKWAAKMGRLLGPWAVPCTRWIFSRFGK